MFYWSKGLQEFCGAWIEERHKERYYKLSSCDELIHESHLRAALDLMESYEENKDGHDRLMEEVMTRGGARASGAEEAGGGREEGSGGAMEGMTEEGGGAGQAAPQAKKAPRLKKPVAAPA